MCSVRDFFYAHVCTLENIKCQSLKLVKKEKNVIIVRQIRRKMHFFDVFLYSLPCFGSLM